MSGHSAEKDAGVLPLKTADCTCGHATISHDFESNCWAGPGGDCECDNDRWEAMYAAGIRVTQECEPCKGSGLYPNPTGVFYAPTEWLGCPDCMGAGRVIPSAETEATT
jgi:hypothetical protein